MRRPIVELITNPTNDAYYRYLILSLNNSLIIFEVWCRWFYERLITYSLNVRVFSSVVVVWNAALRCSASYGEAIIIFWWPYLMPRWPVSQSSLRGFFCTAFPQRKGALCTSAPASAAAAASAAVSTAQISVLCSRTFLERVSVQCKNTFPRLTLGLEVNAYRHKPVMRICYRCMIWWWRHLLKNKTCIPYAVHVHKGCLKNICKKFLISVHTVCIWSCSVGSR